MKKSVLAALSVLFAAQLAMADVLTLEAGPNSIENVNVSTGGTALVQTRSSKLATVGAGLRTKKVAFISVKVYVAQLLVSDASKFIRAEHEALNSLDVMPAVAIRLSFLRNVEADSVKGAFADALAANSVNVSEPAVAAFLNAVSAGGEASEGKSLTIVGEKLANGIEAITYENTQGASVTIQGGTGFVKSILSIWLGNPSDNGVANLKRSLIGA